MMDVRNKLQKLDSNVSGLDQTPFLLHSDYNDFMRDYLKILTGVESSKDSLTATIKVSAFVL